MKKRVIVGPYRVARRYAQSRGWPEGSFVIVTRGHQLAQLDPALITRVIFVKARDLGDRVCGDIIAELNKIRALWPLNTTMAVA